MCRKSNGIIQSGIRSILLYTYTHTHSLLVCLPVHLYVYVCAVRWLAKISSVMYFCKSIFVFEGVSKTTHTAFNICIIVYIYIPIQQMRYFRLFIWFYAGVWSMLLFYFGICMRMRRAREALEVWYDECVYHTNSPWNLIRDEKYLSFNTSRKLRIKKKYYDKLGVFMIFFIFEIWIFLAFFSMFISLFSKTKHGISICISFSFERVVCAYIQIRWIVEREREKKPERSKENKWIL